MSAIFDIDGTLIIKGVRPNPQVIALCNRSAPVFIITGRLENTRADTEAMLHKMGVQYHSLLMNNLGSGADKQLLSKRMNATRVVGNAPVDLAVDDNAIARSMYKDLGIKKVVGP